MDEIVFEASLDMGLEEGGSAIRYFSSTAVENWKCF